jgi:peptidoglycan hydrolase-like protein with peptidoglycan-binding domain
MHMPYQRSSTAAVSLSGYGDDAFPLAQGSRGQRVRQLQFWLSALGYSGTNGAPLKVDGTFGPHTFRAGNDFHSSLGWPPHGAFTELRYNTVGTEYGKWRTGRATQAKHPVQRRGGSPNPPPQREEGHNDAPPQAPFGGEPFASMLTLSHVLLACALGIAAAISLAPPRRPL